MKDQSTKCQRLGDSIESALGYYLGFNSAFYMRQLPIYASSVLILQLEISSRLPLFMQLRVLYVEKHIDAFNAKLLRTHAIHQDQVFVSFFV